MILNKAWMVTASIDAPVCVTANRTLLRDLVTQYRTESILNGSNPSDHEDLTEFLFYKIYNMPYPDIKQDSILDWRMAETTHQLDTAIKELHKMCANESYSNQIINELDTHIKLIEAYHAF